ncbi:MarR family winged helix-turn-helix transcriptional regulator [Pseudohongiella acticola]|jgi:DNA-binding MarR family transcriptional regulator|uniref:MarR family winged helix-turn-helix transcriptional regulator n=1 Tax=Pseudohongiella acticola TaxID=1524254 RepID=UPI0030EDCF6D
MSTHEIPCYAFTARHASRHLSQFYERMLGGSGIHGQQFTIMAIINKKGPLSVIELAEELAMDRTTLARSLSPLERDGYISITSGEKDRRAKAIAITGNGKEKLEVALQMWRQAQAEFELRFGAERAARLREELRAAAEAVAC